MSTDSTGRPSGPVRYEIRLKGRLEPRRADWFDGLALTIDSDGTTALRGVIADQAALHGLLQRLRDVGLPLISVTPLAPDDLLEGRPS